MREKTTDEKETKGDEGEMTKWSVVGWYSCRGLVEGCLENTTANIPVHDEIDHIDYEEDLLCNFKCSMVLAYCKSDINHSYMTVCLPL